MITETYKGRKIRVMKGRQWGTVDATINGEYAPVAACGSDQAKAVGQIKAQIDHIDQEPVNGNRWDAKWYVPGTYELCPNGHPMTIGGPCLHFTCHGPAAGG